jgi:pre-mRNA-processing factor 19
VRATPPLCVQSGSTGGYTCAGFHPDGLILATGTDQVVRVWDLKTQTNPATFEGHTAAVSSVAFSENGYYAATGAADATVKLWDLRKISCVQTLSVSGPVSAVSFDFSGQFLAVASDGLGLYETKGLASLHELAAGGSGAYSGVGFGASASFVAGATTAGVVQLFGPA